MFTFANGSGSHLGSSICIKPEGPLPLDSKMAAIICNVRLCTTFVMSVRNNYTLVPA